MALKNVAAFRRTDTDLSIKRPPASRMRPPLIKTIGICEARANRVHNCNVRERTTAFTSTV